VVLVSRSTPSPSRLPTARRVRGGPTERRIGASPEATWTPASPLASPHQPRAGSPWSGPNQQLPLKSSSVFGLFAPFAPDLQRRPSCGECTCVWPFPSSACVFVCVWVVLQDVSFKAVRSDARHVLGRREIANETRPERQVRPR